MGIPLYIINYNDHVVAYGLFSSQTIFMNMESKVGENGNDGMNCRICE